MKIINQLLADPKEELSLFNRKQEWIEKIKKERELFLRCLLIITLAGGYTKKVLP